MRCHRSEGDGMSASETPRRLTPTEPEAPARMNAATVLRYQHEERMAQALKPAREDRPTFSAKRATTSGALGVWELTVNVPVCDEFPTADEAFAAQVHYMTSLAARFPMPDGTVDAGRGDRPDPKPLHLPDEKGKK
jgi:hypothetical protein